MTPPCRGRVRLTLMPSNFHCLPLRRSSTVRLPFFRPSSRRSCPSRPDSPTASTLAIRVARFSNSARSAGVPGSACSFGPGDAITGFVGSATAIGRLSAPANTVRRPSVSIRTDISAPTRLRLCARSLPISRLLPESPTSAFGALATTVPSASRTTMSRSRSDVRPFASRSSCVPPTATL